MLSLTEKINHFIDNCKFGCSIFLDLQKPLILSIIMVLEIMFYIGSSLISVEDVSMLLLMALHPICYLLLMELHKVQSLVLFYFYLCQ